MARVALELVDAGLVAARDGTVSPASPGLALLDPAGLATGSEAAAQARLKPVYAFDRFWSDLTTDPLPRQVVEARSPADLAYRQLTGVWSAASQPGDDALLVVPGTMGPRELGLLAGIAAAAAIPVAGFVDLAVAVCCRIDAYETVLHLDLHLHQAVLTELQGATLLRRRRTEVAPRVGLRSLHAAWAQLVSEALVRRTRFDPLHQAATEQQLHDRLPAWLQALQAAGSVEVEIEGSAGRFAATLRREQFVLAAEAYYTQLADLVHATRRAGEPVTIVLSARAAALPELAERLASIGGAEPLALPEGAAALGALSRESAFAVGGGVVLVTALDREHPPRRSAVARPADDNAPTHVVFGGRAHAIVGEPLVLGLAPQGGRPLVLSGPAAGVSRSHCSLVAEDGKVVVRDHSRHGTYVNGERVAGTCTVAAGDRLRVGTPGIVVELVAVG